MSGSTGRGGTLVLGVAVLTLLLLVGYPLFWLLLGALGLPGELGLEHFVRVYTRAQNFESLKNTLVLALGTGLLSVALGVPLAWATARSDMPLRPLIQALVALAYVTPPYLTALAYIILLGPEAGYINRLLRWLLGFETGPLNVFSMGGIIFVIGLHVFAFTYFLTHSALAAIVYFQSTNMNGTSRSAASPSSPCARPVPCRTSQECTP